MEINKNDAQLLSKLVNHDFILQNKISFLLIKDYISGKLSRDTIKNPTEKTSGVEKN